MDEIVKQLAASGALGAVLLWFMFRGERLMERNRATMEAMAKSIDANTKSTLVLTLSLPSTKDGARQVCRDLLAELESKPAKPEAAA